MSAIWNSYSKSETARRPRTTAPRPHPVHEVDEQAREALDPAVGLATMPRIISTRSSTVNSGLFSSLLQHGHHHLVEHRAAALDDVEVAVVDGVEGPGVDGDPLGHRSWGKRGLSKVEGDHVVGGIGDPQQTARRPGCAAAFDQQRLASGRRAVRRRPPTGFHSAGVDASHRLADRARVVAHLDAQPPLVEPLAVVPLLRHLEQARRACWSITTGSLTCSAVGRSPGRSPAVGGVRRKR